MGGGDIINSHTLTVLVFATISRYIGGSIWLAGFINGLFASLVFITAASLISYLLEYRRYVG